MNDNDPDKIVQFKKPKEARQHKLIYFCRDCGSRSFRVCVYGEGTDNPIDLECASCETLQYNIKIEDTSV